MLYPNQNFSTVFYFHCRQGPRTREKFYNWIKISFQTNNSLQYSAKSTLKPIKLNDELPAARNSYTGMFD